MYNPFNRKVTYDDLNTLSGEYMLNLNNYNKVYSLLKSSFEEVKQAGNQYNDMEYNLYNVLQEGDKIIQDAYKDGKITQAEKESILKNINEIDELVNRVELAENTYDEALKKQEKLDDKAESLLKKLDKVMNKFEKKLNKYTPPTEFGRRRSKRRRRRRRRRKRSRRKYRRSRRKSCI